MVRLSLAFWPELVHSERQLSFDFLQLHDHDDGNDDHEANSKPMYSTVGRYR